MFGSIFAVGSGSWWLICGQVSILAKNCHVDGVAGGRLEEGLELGKGHGSPE